MRDIRILASALGIVGSLALFIGSWNPSYWGDEAASVLSATRPLATLWPMLGRIDAVHGTYYVFLHFWIDAFGASELSTRLPSVLAAGVAIGGTVVLASQLFTYRAAVIAGLVAIALPRFSYFAAEARSYAIGTALAVWLTILLLTLIRRRITTAWPWIGYAVLVAASIYVFLYLALLMLVHAVVVLTAPHWRAVFRRFVFAMFVAMIVAAPVITFGLGQRDQISFLATRGYLTFRQIFVLQWFGNDWLAAGCWALVVLGIITLARRARTASPASVQKSVGASRQSDVVPPLTTLALITAWLIVPTGVLCLGSVLLSPMYENRYLSFCTPAAALAIAAGITAATNAARIFGPRGVSRAVPAVAVLTLVAAAMPTLIYQRGEFAKDGGSDWRQASAVIEAVKMPGDGILFDEDIGRNARRPRLAKYLYPNDFSQLIDLRLKTPHAQRAGLWDSTQPLLAVAEILPTRIIDLEFDHPASRSNARTLQKLGYTMIQSIGIHRTTVYVFSKATL